MLELIIASGVEIRGKADVRELPFLCRIGVERKMEVELVVIGGIPHIKVLGELAVGNSGHDTFDDCCSEEKTKP